jgi:hypothetical protein
MKKYSWRRFDQRGIHHHHSTKTGVACLTEMKQNSLKRGLNEREVYVTREITASRYPEGTNVRTGG